MKRLVKSFFIVIIFLLGIATSVSAQEKHDTTSFLPLVKFPLLSLHYINYSQSDFNISTSEKGKVNMSEIDGTFQLAFKLKEKKSYLLNRFRFNKMMHDVKIDGVVKPTESFYAFGYTIGLIQVLPKRWQLIASITPTLASDFEYKLSSDDLIMQTMVLLNKRHSEYLEYGFGAACNTRFGRELLMPLASINYRNNRWGFFAFLPAYVSQYYHFKNSRIGLTMSVYGNVYNFAEETGNTKHDKVGYTRINIGPAYRTKIYKDLYLGLSAGMTVRNRLESITNKGRTGPEYEVDEKYFFKLELNILK
ncbi:MAG: DUF6268 family outer membrane beta-barrel protein [Carboxylicivirga sp.]|nr:DUF6268 family outer membrane beta-barrel protein [Carboxylicivirga sp.]